MAMLKLTVATGGLSLSIPAQSVRTVDALEPGRFTDAPDAGCIIRYLIGNQVRTRVLAESADELRAMLAEDRSARTDWQWVEMANGQAGGFVLADLAAIEELDPEQAASQGCNALIDLSIEGVSIIDIRANADVAELRQLAWPDAGTAAVTAPR